MDPWSHFSLPQTSKGEDCLKNENNSCEISWPAMGIQKKATMLFHDDFNDTCTVSSTSSDISRRNLAEAFELQVEAQVSATPMAKHTHK
jgi:hypothetical protein